MTGGSSSSSSPLKMTKGTPLPLPKEDIPYSPTVEHCKKRGLELLQWSKPDVLLEQEKNSFHRRISTRLYSDGQNAPRHRLSQRKLDAEKTANVCPLDDVRVSTTFGLHGHVFTPCTGEDCAARHSAI